MKFYISQPGLLKSSMCAELSFESAHYVFSNPNIFLKMLDHQVSRSRNKASNAKNPQSISQGELQSELFCQDNLQSDSSSLGQLRASLTYGRMRGVRMQMRTGIGKKASSPEHLRHCNPELI